MCSIGETFSPPANGACTGAFAQGKITVGERKYVPTTIEKRDGRAVPFEMGRVWRVISLAANDVLADREKAASVADVVSPLVGKVLSGVDATKVEAVQDIVERCLMDAGYQDIAKAYILYRAKRSRAREARSAITKTMFDLTFQDAIDSDLQRENANIDADTSMGTMLKYGSENAKRFYLNNLMSPEFAEAHRAGDIHIHDLDFYALTETCCQIDLSRLFQKGFYSGHGYVRTPNSIGAYAALACIVIQANQNDQHGGQSLPNFEYDLAPGVSKTFRKEFLDSADFLFPEGFPGREAVTALFEQTIQAGDSVLDKRFLEQLRALTENFFPRVYEHALRKTRRATYQAMEALMHNLNMMQSRAGSQVPFSSLNYGTGTSPEQRMIIEECLKALDAGLGDGETSIFPIHIFRVLDGVNGEPGDPNYDLFQLACKVTAKRLFPNFLFLDAPYNKAFLQPGNIDTYVATMGCRTRVMANINGTSTTTGRGNLSFTTLNLPRLAMKAQGDIDAFLGALDEKVDLIVRQLLERLDVQSHRHAYNYPFLMGQGIWKDSDTLQETEEVGRVLRHGTLTVGFIGLAEALTALVGTHHGESEEARQLGLRIIRRMRELLDGYTRQHKLNFSLIATPAEGLAGRFVAKDRQIFGTRKGITDRDYYTNSFHIPVWFPCTIRNKIRWEAPYHELCNGGHITYVELDGDVSRNAEAVEDIVRLMKHAGIGYGSINHAVDHDPVCGYTGIIDDVCPRCGRREGEAISEEALAAIKKKYAYRHASCPCAAGK